MPNISAKIIADSVSPEGVRLTTIQISFPKFVLAEFNTHRVFSRNFSSTRAIPTQKLIDMIRQDPVLPIRWGSNKPGMQAGVELDPEDIGICQSIWLNAMNEAISSAEALMRAGLHKQWAGRILEPFMPVNGVVTATEWANFFALRAHPDAQPEIKVLAEAMMAAMGQSDPELLQPGDWHLPYITHADHETGLLYGNTADGSWLDILKKVSVARCARVSYLTHDGRKTTVEEDLALYEKLVVSQPLHASPAEHQATPDQYESKDAMMSKWAGKEDPSSNWKEEYSWQPVWDKPHLHGNFQGWIQYRKTLPNEFVAG